MEDYLPQRSTQRAVGFMWHKYLIERDKQRIAHERIRACVEEKVTRLVKEIHYKIILGGKEKVA